MTRTETNITEYTRVTRVEKKYYKLNKTQMNDYLAMKVKGGSKNMSDIKVITTNHLVWGTTSYLIPIRENTAWDLSRLGFPEVTYLENPESDSDSGSWSC